MQCRTPVGDNSSVAVHAVCVSVVQPTVIRLHLDPGDLVEMSFQLTERDIGDFQGDGAVCLRGVFSAEWLVKARVGIEKTLAKPSQYR